MKVLKRGDGDWRRVKCPHCRSKLKIDASDLVVAKEWDDADRDPARTSVACVVCGEEFRVSVPPGAVANYEALEKRRDHDL